MAYTFMESDTHCLLIAEVTMVWRKPDAGDKFGPYKNPADHLDLVEFCSDWDYYTVRNRASVSLVHQSVASAALYDSRWGGGSVIGYGQTLVQDQILVEHNAGYKPRFIVCQNGSVLPNGLMIQTLPDGRGRIVSFYATDTHVMVRNIGGSSASALPSITVDYEVVVFKRPDESLLGPGLPMFWASASRAIMGRGRIDTNTTTMRAGSVEESPLWIALGRTFDFDKGAVRVVVPNGPTITQAGYAGSFTGSAYERAFI